MPVRLGHGLFAPHADAAVRIAADRAAGTESAPHFLARAVNRAKDQSYVLFGIRRDAVPRCLFPIGSIADKAEVRRIAADLGLRVHDKPDSQEICFVPGNDYRRLVHARAPHTRRPGEIRDCDGRVLAMHEGTAAFTIGQRRGLGFAAGRPLYVIAIDAEANVVTVGPRDALFCFGLIAEGVNWLIEPPAPGSELNVSVKIRHMHAPAAARLRGLEGGRVAVRFAQPQLAVTPGQAAVFYDGDIVLGGGWIGATAAD